MPQVLIAGCGYIGTALAKVLVTEGSLVWGLRRRTQFLSPQIRPISADLHQARTLSSLPTGLDYLFYTAAPEKSDDASYRLTYVEGLKNLVKSLEEQQICPKRGFFTSSTAVYVQHNGEWVDEDSPAEAKHFSGSRLLEAERFLSESPFPWTVVRLSGIYGPTRSRLIEQIKRGELTSSGASLNYTNRIHRDDCAGVLHHLMLLENPSELYLGTDYEPARLREVVQWLSERLVASEVNLTQAPRRIADRFQSNKRCRNNRILESGYRFRYPTYRDGYSDLLTGANSKRG